MISCVCLDLPLIIVHSRIHNARNRGAVLLYECIKSVTAWTCWLQWLQRKHYRNENFATYSGRQACCVVEKRPVISKCQKSNLENSATVSSGFRCHLGTLKSLEFSFFHYLWPLGSVITLQLMDGILTSEALGQHSVCLRQRPFQRKLWNLQYSCAHRDVLGTGTYWQS